MVNSQADEYQKSITEIIISIYYLSDFIREHESIFHEHSKKLEVAVAAVKKSQQFLSAKFADLADRINDAHDAGQEIRACRICSFHSAIVQDGPGGVYNVNCLVCEKSDRIVRISCPNEDCQIDVEFHAWDGFQIRLCECGNSIDQRELFSLLDTSTFDDQLIESPINCGECGTPEVVAQTEDYLICCECFSTAEYAGTCEWCHERQLGGGDLEFSEWSGCEFCDGRKGWDTD